MLRELSIESLPNEAPLLGSPTHSITDPDEVFVDIHPLACSDQDSAQCEEVDSLSGGSSERSEPAAMLASTGGNTTQMWSVAAVMSWFIVIFCALVLIVAFSDTADHKQAPVLVQDSQNRTASEPVNITVFHTAGEILAQRKDEAFVLESPLVKLESFGDENVPTVMDTIAEITVDNDLQPSVSSGEDYGATSLFEEDAFPPLTLEVSLMDYTNPVVEEESWPLENEADFSLQMDLQEEIADAWNARYARETLLDEFYLEDSYDKGFENFDSFEITPQVATEDYTFSGTDFLYSNETDFPVESPNSDQSSRVFGQDSPEIEGTNLPSLLEESNSMGSLVHYEMDLVELFDIDKEPEELLSAIFSSIEEDQGTKLAPQGHVYRMHEEVRTSNAVQPEILTDELIIDADNMVYITEEPVDEFLEEKTPVARSTEVEIPVDSKSEIEIPLESPLTLQIPVPWLAVGNSSNETDSTMTRLSDNSVDYTDLEAPTELASALSRQENQNLWSPLLLLALSVCTILLLALYLQRRAYLHRQSNERRVLGDEEEVSPARSLPSLLSDRLGENTPDQAPLTQTPNHQKDTPNKNTPMVWSMQDLLQSVKRTFQTRNKTSLKLKSRCKIQPLNHFPTIRRLDTLPADRWAVSLHNEEDLAQLGP